MSRLTTHVLDTSKGLPARGVALTLEHRQVSGAFFALGAGATDDDGRCKALLPEGVALSAGVYRLTFETGGYFAAAGTPSFFPSVSIVFEVTQPERHHHVPLLLSPFGYSTYRGS